MTEFLERLDNSKAFLYSIILGAIFYVTMYDDGSIKENQIENLNVQVQKNTTEIIKLKKEIREIQGFIVTMNKLGAKFDKLLQYIPEKFNVNDQQKIISTEARSVGAEVTSLKSVGGGEKFSFYEEIKVTVRLKGAYSQIILFLSNLTKINKVIVMDKMTLSTVGAKIKGEPSAVSFSGTFIGYRYIKDKSGGLRR